MFFPRINFPGWFIPFRKEGKADGLLSSSDDLQSSSSELLDDESQESHHSPDFKSLAAKQNNDSNAICVPELSMSRDEHHQVLGEHLENLWRHGEITDLVIRLRNKDYACHRTVLSCHSNYFNSCFLKFDRNVNTIELKMPSVTNAAFEVLLNFMYTSKLHLHVQNIEEVYAAAKKLKVDTVTNQCLSVISGESKSDVHPVYIFVMAWKQKQTDRVRKALRIMAHNFEQIIGTPEFQNLNFPQVRAFLSQDALAIRSEVMVYLAALNWLSFKYIQREHYAGPLMRCVRFPMMSLDELLACFSPPQLPGVLEMTHIRNQLLKATCYVAAKTINEEVRFEKYSCKPRRFLLPRENVVLWDPSVHGSNSKASHNAACTIQAAWKGYKTRKSVSEILSKHQLTKPSEVDTNTPEEQVESIGKTYTNQTDYGQKDQLVNEPPTAPFQKSPIMQSVSEEKLMDKPAEITTPVDEDKQTVSEDKPTSESPQSSEEPYGNEPKYNALDSLEFPNYEDTKAVPTSPLSSSSKAKSTLLKDCKKMFNFLKGSKDSVNKDKEEEKPTEKEDWKKDEISKDPGRIRKSSSESLVGQRNGVSVRTNLKRYISDTIQRSQSQPLEIFHKIYTRVVPQDKLQKIDFKEAVSSTLTYDEFFRNNAAFYIVATGGFRADTWKDEDEGKDIYLLDIFSEKWIKCGEMEIGRHHHCMVFMNGAMYFIGGCNPKITERGWLIAEKTCYKLETESGRWSEIAEMEHSRMYHGVTALDGKIYAIGGKNEYDKALNSVEVFDPDINEWKFLNTFLETPRFGTGVCTHKETIWIVGGMVQDSSDGSISVINDVKCYDPKNQRWIQITPLPGPRTFAAVVSYDNHVYVIGGTTQSRESSDEELISISDVLFYDEEQQQWIYVASFPFERHFVQVLVVEDRLYALGGLTTFEKASVDNVLKYDKISNKWVSISSMPVPLCGFAAVSMPASALKIDSQF